MKELSFIITASNVIERAAGCAVRDIFERGRRHRCHVGQKTFQRLFDTAAIATYDAPSIGGCYNIGGVMVLIAPKGGTIMLKSIDPAEKGTLIFKLKRG